MPGCLVGFGYTLVPLSRYGEPVPYPAAWASCTSNSFHADQLAPVTKKAEVPARPRSLPLFPCPLSLVGFLQRLDGRTDTQSDSGFSRSSCLFFSGFSLTITRDLHGLSAIQVDWKACVGHELHVCPAWKCATICIGLQPASSCPGRPEAQQPCSGLRHHHYLLGRRPFCGAPQHPSLICPSHSRLPCMKPHSGEPPPPPPQPTAGRLYLSFNRPLIPTLKDSNQADRAFSWAFRPGSRLGCELRNSRRHAKNKTHLLGTPRGEEPR